MLSFRMGFLVVALAACGGLGGYWYVNRPCPSGECATDPPAPSLANQSDETTLDEKELQLLWEIEHEGNLLTKFGFKPFAAALVEGDGMKLDQFLADNFTGQILRSPREVAVQTDYLEVARQTDRGEGFEAVDRARFIDRLLDLRRPFKGKVSAKLALMKLSPTVRGDLDKPWEGTGQLRLWGEREPGKPGEVIAYLKYRIPRPTEETLKNGGWLASCSITQSQVGRAEGFLMQDVARARGLEVDKLQDSWKPGDQKEMPAVGVYLCDFNRDGILDMLVTDRNGFFLYQGQLDGTFRNVTQEMGLPSKPSEESGAYVMAAFADLDGDGWEDLILDRHIYRNDQGRRFVDVTVQCILNIPENAEGIAIADYDRDGLLDLYVFHTGKGQANSWLEGKGGLGKGNQLWHNEGNWRFKDVTRASGTSGGDRSTFTALWFDANNDGWPDLYVPNEFGNGVLLINQHNGKFEERSLVDNPSDFGTMGATCGDIDNDGNIDLYCANMYSKAGARVFGNLLPDCYPKPIMDKLITFVKGSQLHLNRGGLKFDQVAKEMQVADAGWAYGPALVDLDNDGWLDIYATAGFVSRSRTEPDG
jgi:hypothetical protein